LRYKGVAVGLSFGIVRLLKTKNGSLPFIPSFQAALPTVEKYA
jgi:hypothetical protein